ncbi:hypothetical protein GCM10029978_067830 [Actinoallomurus acanthiterrae]
MQDGIIIEFSGRLAQAPRGFKNGNDDACELCILQLVRRQGRRGAYNEAVTRRAVAYDPELAAHIMDEGYAMNDRVRVVATDMSAPQHLKNNGVCEVRQPSFLIFAIEKDSAAAPAGDLERDAQNSVLSGLTR